MACKLTRLDQNAPEVRSAIAKHFLEMELTLDTIEKLLELKLSTNLGFYKVIDSVSRINDSFLFFDDDPVCVGLTIG